MIKKIIKKIRTAIFILLGVALLLLLVLQLPKVQNIIAQKIVLQINKNLGISLSVNQVKIVFFNRVKIKDIHLGPQPDDTVVFISEISVGVKLTELLNDRIHINSFHVKGADINFTKTLEDSVLNIVSLFPAKSANKNKKEDKKPLQFALNKLELTDIDFQLEDRVDSNSFHLVLDEFDLRFNLIDLQKKKIDVKSVSVNGLMLDIIQSALKNEEEKEPKPFAYDISFQQMLKASNININYKNSVTKQEIAVKKANLKVKPNKIDIRKKTINLKEVELSNAMVDIRQNTHDTIDSVQISGVEPATQAANFLWDIHLETLWLKQNNLQVSKSGLKGLSNTSKSEMIDIDDISSKIEDLKLKDEFYAARIKTLQFNVNDTFELKNLSANAEVNNHSAKLENLLIELGESSLGLNAEFTYTNLDEIQNNLKDLSLNFDFQAQTELKDLHPFIPDITFLKKYPNVELSGKFSGKLSQIRIDDLALEVSDALKISVTGSMDNLPEMKEVSGDLYIENMIIDKNALLDFVADSLMPEAINLPDTIRGWGNLKGNRAVVESDLKLETSYGKISSRFKLNIDDLSGAEYFLAYFDIENFDAGVLLNKQDTVGSVTLTGKVNGVTSGFSEPDVHLDMDVKEVNFLNYNYKNIHFEGNYSENFFDGLTQINDKNISFGFSGKLDLSDSIPEFDFELDISHANLMPLNIAQNTTNVSGKFVVNAKGKEWNKLKGRILAEDISYQTDKQKYGMDSLQVDLIQGTPSSNYQLHCVSIYKNDTVLAPNANIRAVITGKKADINYHVSSTNRLFDAGNGSMIGDGIVYFSKDSLMMSNNLRIEKSIYPEPMDFFMEFSQVKKGKNLQEINLLVEGRGVGIHASGSLEEKEEAQAINAVVTIDTLNLDLAQPFTKSQFETLSGHLTGRFDVSGTTGDPKIKGTLSIINTVINPKAVNTDFIFENEQITIDKSVVQFDKFTIADNNDNKAVINGSVDFRKTATNNFYLSLTAGDFMFLDKPAATANLYYGNVTADVKAFISGTFASPEVSVNTAFKNKSEFFFVVPQNRANAKKQENIIEFVDKNKNIDTTNSEKVQENQEFERTVANFELTTNIEITDNITITLITDPASDENLEIKGNGNLSFSINKSGNMSLTGRYAIEEGKYKLRLYDVIKREFEIEKDSYLSWSGDLLEANADISAVYSVKTPTIELMQTWLPNISEEDAQRYSDPISVKVIMNLSGNLLTPEIDFDIEIDKSYQGSEIQAAITNLNQNESELNKQVFSLLIFNDFSGDGPVGGNTRAYELKNTARQNLSNLLSQQLNRFSRQYITGVDLSFDIDSYNQHVQDDVSTRTDLSVDVSRKLFNERLTVEVGGRVAVEEKGKQTENQVGANNLAGDFKLEYKLSKDGTYRLQAFNKTEFEDEIDGEVTKTGISFIFNKDFKSFKDLFKRGKKQKNKKSEN